MALRPVTPPTEPDAASDAAEVSGPAGPGEAVLANGCELLRALGTPHRLAIVLQLAERPRCVHELVDDLGISPSLASQHLRVLRTTGLVTAARRGKETVYTLADEHVAHIAQDAITHGTEAGHRSSAPPDPTTETTEVHQP